MPPFLSVVCPLIIAIGAAMPPAAAEVRAAPVGAAVTSPSIETVRSHRYRLSGRIRPLLVWMGRDDVGFARVAWRADAEGRPGYELLIGTDPSRAPRGLNRWGYVAEQATVSGGDVLALMTGAMAGSLQEASDDARGGPAGARLHVLRGRLSDGLARSQVSLVGFDRAQTIHDAGTVLERLRYEPASTREATAPGRTGARPGLLSAIADTLDRLLPDARHGQVRASSEPVPYVFGRDAYELRLRSAAVVDADAPGAVTVRALETDFEIRTLATGARSRFSMRTALDGAIAGVPLAVRWQPRWWLEIGLHLSE